MKINKIIIAIILTFSCHSVQANTSIKVKTNIPSGEYNSVLEIFLVSNKPDSKIFYSQNLNSKLDSQIEYSKDKPIILKKSSDLYYYSFLDLKNSTLINTSSFKINYPKEIGIFANEKNIFIRNNTKKIINIGYWKILGDTLNYNIPKNTFLKVGENYITKYNSSENESIKLFSPDEKVKKEYILPKKIVEKIKTTEKIKNITPKKTIQNIDEIKKEKLLEIPKNNEEILTTQLEIKKIPSQKVSKTNFNNSLKTSLIESNNTYKNDDENNSKSIIFKILFGIILIFLLGYNGYLFYINKYQKKIPEKIEDKTGL